MKALLAGLSGDRIECELAGALRDAGVDLSVIAEPGSPGAEACNARGIPCRPLSYRHRFDRAAIRTCRSLLATEPRAILHALTNRALSTALLACRTLPDPPKIFAYRGTVGHLSRWDPASRLSYLNPRVDVVICVSGAVRRYLLSLGVPDHKLRVVWKGHDPAWYSAAPRTALTALGIPPGACVASFSGNVRPVKGLAHLLDAVESLDTDPPLHLLVMGRVGDGGLRRRLRRHPRVHAVGFRQDAAPLAGACDLACVPSVAREGLPKAALESMAQGIPIVATRVGGLPELVVDGETGFLVPPENAGALAEAIRRLVLDPCLRRRLGAAARARIEGPFHFRHTVSKTLAAYREAVDDPPNRAAANPGGADRSP